ncbi:LpqN/LpqT family lipoprotein [Candidatus Mycobacterium wuenschmannii]|uniref:LpqN/LpqT family lipoprotein n=1 Tax=Candidatus Mycobacterium wuenschmannii TaxID=3027808 RepID=A0ABY8VUR6_9MYCO|nr:LpqN/LpqT family lipoprotein [Candidatus Mycobacterium wuenschmannii]WIM86691.1 LpqN/LpqT family lipoprotein [Candidatus Mycobacterium wuenschmannii]
MKHMPRSWRATVAGLAVGAAGVLSVACPIASADPVFPPRPGPVPVPAPVPQVPQAVPGALGNPMPGLAPQAPLAVPAAAPVAPVPAPPPAAAVPPALMPATAGTLREFFNGKGVKMEPQKAAGFNALDLVLPVPQGWTQVPDPNVPDAFVVIANRRSPSLYAPNAQLVVYRLVGDFDPHEAISHGYIDTQQLPAWRNTDASLVDYNGSPSALIEGTFRQNEMTLNTSRRHVIVTSGPDKYLVSLSVTTEAGGGVGEAQATDGIVNGFRAGAPGSNPPASGPAPVAPPQARPLPSPGPGRPTTGGAHALTNRALHPARTPRMVSPCSSRECCASARRVFWPFSDCGR